MRWGQSPADADKLKPGWVMGSVGWGKTMKITTQKQAETVPAKATPYGLGNNLYLDVKGETRAPGCSSGSCAAGTNMPGSARPAAARVTRCLWPKRARRPTSTGPDRQGKDPRAEDRRESSRSDRPRKPISIDTGRLEERQDATSLGATSFFDHAKELADRPLATITAADISRWWIVSPRRRADASFAPGWKRFPWQPPLLGADQSTRPPWKRSD